MFTVVSLFQDQKKLQGQLIAEQEALYGSKPSPSKAHSVKKAPRASTGGGAGPANHRRLSVGGATTLHTPKPDLFNSTKATPQSRTMKKFDRTPQNDYPNLRQDDGLVAVAAGMSLLQIFSLLLSLHFCFLQTYIELCFIT